MVRYLAPYLTNKRGPQARPTKLLFTRASRQGVYSAVVGPLENHVPGGHLTYVILLSRASRQECLFCCRGAI